MNKLNQTKSIWISLLLALTMILGSCSKDFLNTRPVGRVLEVNYYQTEEQAFEALVSIYDVLQWNDQYGFTMFRFLQNVASDDTYAGGSDASDQPSWVAYNNFTLTPNLGPQRGFWRKGYKGIYRANLFLEKIDEIEDASEAFRTRTKAEAKFLRAKFYFDLSIAHGTESAGAFYPRKVATVGTGSSVRVKFCILHVERFNAFVVQVDVA